MREDQIIQKLKDAFKDDSIKRQVLDEEWYSLNIDNKIDSTGFCFAASEVLFRLTGGTKKWQINYLKDPTHWNHGTHYFLRRREADGSVDKTNDQNIVDITAEQYTGREIVIPYVNAKARGLQRTSKKARLLARLAGLGEIS
jgi:hypothetical protein